MLDTQLDQTGGFSHPHFTRNIFTHASGDYPTYPSIDPRKPPEFNDLPFEGLRTH